MWFLNLRKQKALDKGALEQVLQTAFTNAMQQMGLNQGVTLYPSNTGQSHIQKAYNKNAAVYSIVSKCAKKFAQVPWYHYRIKKTELKTWEEYRMLTKDLSPQAVLEARKMRTKSVEQVKVDSDLQKFLNKPNRYQSGAMFREQLYGFKLLTGEGNSWFTRIDQKSAPVEMLLLPKSTVAIIKGMDAWDVKGYEVALGVNRFTTEKENLLMWKFPNYEFSETDLRHLRGQSPLDAGLLLIQASNEADERRVAMNKNQGVAGLAFNESDTKVQDFNDPGTINRAMFQRRQFNSIVNDKDLAGSIAVMMGKWGFIQFGLDAGQLKLLEQTDITMDGLCNIFDVPPGMFRKDQTYENRKEQKRELIYDNIAVAAYGLRDEWSAKLVPEFNLDQERDVIDCDILSLPELAEDLKTQAEAVGKLWSLTPNEVREYIGYDKSTDPNMDKVYIPSTYTTLDQANDPIGNNLDNEVNALNG